MDDEQQSFLPQWAELDADRRAAAVGAVATLGLKPAHAREAVTLLLYLDGAARDRAGCRSFLETIQAAMERDKVGLPRRTLQRRLALLRERGLVKQWWHRGRSVNRVEWQEIRRLAFGQPSRTTHDAPDGRAVRETSDVRRPALRQSRPANMEPERPKAGDGRPEAERSSPTSSLQPPASGADPAAAPAHQTSVAGQADAAEKSGAGSRQSGAGSRQSGAGSRQSGAANITCFFRPNSFTSSSLAAPKWRGVAAERDRWEEEEDRLRELGIMRAAHACRMAADRGLEPADLAAIADVLAANRERWRRCEPVRPGGDEPRPGDELGVLFLRLEEARPGQDWSDLALWPRPAEAWRQREAQRQRREAAVRSAAANRTARAQDQQEADALEAAHGAALDALAPDDVGALAARAGKFLADLHRRDGVASPLVRGALLSALAKERTR